MRDYAADRHPRTKIIATLGPASATRARLAQMLDIGLDVCRLNFSHGDLAEHKRTLDLVRTLAAERDEPVCVVGDLCGPKIRLGQFGSEPVVVKPGDAVRFVRGEGPCDAQRLTVSLPSFVEEVEALKKMGLALGASDGDRLPNRVLGRRQPGTVARRESQLGQ